MEWIELGELCEIKGGQGAPQNKDTYSDEGVPFIRAGDLQALVEGELPDVCNKIKQEVGDAKGLKLQEKGTVVFAKSGMSCLKSYIYWLPVSCYAVNHLACLTVTDNRLISKYLSYALNFIKPKKLINDLSYPSIRLSDIAKMKIPVPPLEIQKQIVEILDTAQGLIDKRREQIRLLDELIEAIFYDMFGDPVKNEKVWEVRKLGKYFNIKTGKTPKRGREEYWEAGTINWVKTGEILNNLITNTEEKITQKAVKELNMYVYNQGDILVAMYGQGNTRGRIAKVGINTTTNQACAGLVKKEKAHINSEFVYKYLFFSYERLRNLGRGGNQPNLNLNMIRNFKIPIPPISLQNEFAAKVEAIEEQKRLLEKSLKLLEDNYNSLMQRAFKGELF